MSTRTIVVTPNHLSTTGQKQFPTKYHFVTISCANFCSVYSLLQGRKKTALHRFSLGTAVCSLFIHGQWQIALEEL